jgi:hypothetical protein
VATLIKYHCAPFGAKCDRVREMCGLWQKCNGSESMLTVAVNRTFGSVSSATCTIDKCGSNISTGHGKIWNNRVLYMFTWRKVTAVGNKSSIIYGSKSIITVSSTISNNKLTADSTSYCSSSFSIVCNVITVDDCRSDKDIRQ